MHAREESSGQGKPLFFERLDNWETPVETRYLLDELERSVVRFVALPPAGAAALALWILHTYAVDAAEVAPILALISPDKRCGKTTTLRLLERLVPRPLLASNITSAALFRTVEKYNPTLLIDEADTFVHAREDLLGVLNSGHTRRSSVIIRTVGPNHHPRSFRTFGPKAIALIGRLPGTLEDRSIVIPLRRRRRTEFVERMRVDRLDEFEPIRRKALRWALDNLGFLQASDPVVPAELDDRSADNWRPLFAIADLAGPTWLEKAQFAALVLSGSTRELDTTQGIQLLADLRDVFLRRRCEKALASADVVEWLGRREDRPWAEYCNDKSITPVQVARILRPFRITPSSIRFKDGIRKGYYRASFEDAFARYLPAEPEQPEHIAKDTAVGTPLDCNGEAHVACGKIAVGTQFEHRVSVVPDLVPGGLPPVATRECAIEDSAEAQEEVSLATSDRCMERFLLTVGVPKTAVTALLRSWGRVPDAKTHV